MGIGTGPTEAMKRAVATQIPKYFHYSPNLCGLLRAGRKSHVGADGAKIALRLPLSAKLRWAYFCCIKYQTPRMTSIRRILCAVNAPPEDELGFIKSASRYHLRTDCGPRRASIARDLSGGGSSIFPFRVAETSQSRPQTEHERLPPRWPPHETPKEMLKCT